MKKPRYYLIFKIIGFIGIGIVVAGLILSVTGFGDFESNNFMIGMFLAPIGLFISAFCLAQGFRPEMTRMSAQSMRYIQNENKEIFTDIANTTAEITQNAIAQTAKAVCDGISGDKIYCKHCGAMIDSDSKFCSKCGKEQ